MVKGLDYFVRKASLVTFSCKDCSVTCCDVEYRRRRSYSYVSGCIAGQPIQSNPNIIYAYSNHISWKIFFRFWRFAIEFYNLLC